MYGRQIIIVKNISPWIPSGILEVTQRISTDVTNEAGTAYPSDVPGVTPGF